jgi:hypothetical protein
VKDTDQRSGFRDQKYEEASLGGSASFVLDRTVRYLPDLAGAEAGFELSWSTVWVPVPLARW